MLSLLYKYVSIRNTALFESSPALNNSKGKLHMRKRCFKLSNNYKSLRNPIFKSVHRKV